MFSLNTSVFLELKTCIMILNKNDFLILKTRTKKLKMCMISFKLEI